MEIELKIKQDIYSNKDPKKPLLIKKDVTQRLYTDTDDILNIKEIFTKRGAVDKQYCLIHLKDLGEIVVNHSYDYIVQRKTVKTPQVGFKYKNRK